MVIKKILESLSNYKTVIQYILQIAKDSAPL